MLKGEFRNAPKNWNHRDRQGMRNLPYLPDFFGDMLFYLAGGYHSGNFDCGDCGTAQEEGAADERERLKKAYGF